MAEKKTAKRKLLVDVEVGSSRKASLADIEGALRKKLKTEPTEFREGDQIVIDFNWIDESGKKPKK